MNKLFYCLIFIATSGWSQSTSGERDSLWAILDTTQSLDLKFDVHYALATWYEDHQLDSTIFHASQMRSLAKQLKNPVKEREALIQMGLGYGYAYRFEDERQFYRKALEVSVAGGDEKGKAISLLNLGVSFSFDQNLDSSAYYYEQARAIFEILEDKKNLSYTYNNLGLIYRKLRKYDDAIGIYKRSINIKEQLGDQKGIINTSLNLSAVYVNIDSLEQARYYSRLAMDLAAEAGLQNQFISGQINLGLVFRKLGNSDSAFYYLQRATNGLATFKDNELKTELELNLAELYFEQKNMQAVWLHLTNLKKALEVYKNLEVEKLYHELAYRYHKHQKDFPAALLELELFTEKQEKFLSEKSIEQINDLQLKYETAEKEKQIAALEVQRQKSDLDITRAQNERNWFVSGFLIFVVIALIFYYQVTVKRKNEKILEQKNAQISKALDDREMLLREIHHRVKNNLQVISSLLNLQAGSLEDSNAASAVLEGQSRVKSMALIHQNLYQNTDLRGVDIGDYLRNLGAELINTFGMNEKIDFSVDTANLKMDIDTLIPLGLILNELLTNSLKYAFVELDKGLLSIRLSEKDNQLNVLVSDNGVGFNEEKIKLSNSFGWKLIHSLSRKLKAEIRIESNQGTQVLLIISRYKLVA